MLLPPGRALELVAPSVPVELCPPELVQRARDRIEGWPSCWSWSILETRLGGRAPERVDLLLCADRREAQAPAGLIDMAGMAGPDHAAVARFFGAWLEPGGLLEREVPLCWVEYDLPPSESPPPFVQYCVVRSYPERLPSRALAPERLAAVARRGLGAALGGAPPSGHLDALRHAAECLPEGCCVLHVGVIPHRMGSDVRAIAVLDPREVIPWLSRLDWEGAAGGLERLLELTAPDQRRLSVQIDVGDRIGPRVGIEFAQLSVDGSSPQWRAFMARLEGAGLCSHAQGRAALGWLGCESHPLGEPLGRVALQRSLDVKIVLEGDGSLAAKAYLCTYPRRSVF